MEYTGHCADVMSWYADRIDLLLREDVPQLQPFDWDAHTRQQCYSQQATLVVIADLNRSCARLSDILQALSHAEWRRTGMGSDRSLRSVRGLAERAAHEAVHHSFDIRAGLLETGSALTPTRPEPIAVVFDFDGLLMDTESTSLAGWEHEWSQWGLRLDRHQFFVEHGGDVSHDRYATLARAVGPEFDRDLSHRRRTAYRDRLHEKLTLAAGIEDWLHQARAAGLRLAVASSSPVPWVEKHLRQAGVLAMFDVIAGGDQVPRHKPAPDVYLLALRRMGIRKTDAVAVEDTPHGIDAAHAAGLPCIAIPNPFIHPTRVSHAEVVLDSANQTTLLEAVGAAATLAPKFGS